MSGVWGGKHFDQGIGQREAVYNQKIRRMQVQFPITRFSATRPKGLKPLPRCSTVGLVRPACPRVADDSATVSPAACQAAAKVAAVSGAKASSQAVAAAAAGVAAGCSVVVPKAVAYAVIAGAVYTAGLFAAVRALRACMSLLGATSPQSHMSAESEPR